MQAVACVVYPPDEQRRAQRPGASALVSTQRIDAGRFADNPGSPGSFTSARVFGKSVRSRRGTRHCDRESDLHKQPLDVSLGRRGERRSGSQETGRGHNRPFHELWR